VTPTPAAATEPAAEPAPAPTLDVRVTPPHARILVDGAAVASEHGRIVRPVAAGEHQVRVEAAGFAPYNRTIAVSGTVVLDVVLAAAPSRRGTTGAKKPVTTTPTQAESATKPLDPNATIEPFQ
jgi:hypothetical protein